MAGDPHLAPSSPTTSAGWQDRGHDPAELAVWLSWFTRVRWVVPLLMFPGSYLVHLLLNTEYHTTTLLSLCATSLVVNAACARILSELRHDLQGNARKLRWLASGQTLADILFLVSCVHEAGGAMGPFWPFPFIPIILGAALLPSVRALVLHSVFATGCTAISAWDQGAAGVVAPLVMSVMFMVFGAVLSYVLARGLQTQREVGRELERTRVDKELAQAMARRREEILSVVSHELASPLMTLRGYVLLMKEATQRDPADQKLLARIERQVGRMSSLADDLLEMASTRAGAMHLHRSQFDLVAALREYRDGARLQFPEADIRIIGESTMRGVWDRHRLDQLFGNLVSNAVKFAGARCKINIEVLRNGPREALVLVGDDGPGISADALRNIFEPFQRYSTERGGLGLGLAIAQSVVEMHDGRIWAECPEGKGAVFHVVLPTDAKASGQHPVVDSASRDRSRLGAS